MSITINVAGQVRQINLATSKALWPLFETVINSIQSLEDTNCTEEKVITIEARRNPLPQLSLDASEGQELQHFEDFIITDNGNGFNNDNYRSFLEAYSQLKVHKGCKGIGRFLWLKAFDKVEINSIFYENGKWYQREFAFSLDGIIPDDNLRELGNGSFLNKTVVKLIGFNSKYRDNVSANLETIAKRIIEHCLPYFIMGNCPSIHLKDDCNTSIRLNSFYSETYKDSLHQDSITLFGKDYMLYHMLISTGADKHELHLCANNREVKSYDLSRYIPNLQKKIETELGNCYYIGYLAGDYLDESVNTERAEFNFSDMPILGDNNAVSEIKIVTAVLDMIKNYLHDDLDRINEDKKQQIDRIVHSQKPQYRLLLKNNPEVYDMIPNGLTDEKVDFELYKHQQRWERSAVELKHNIDERLRKDATSDPDFARVFEEYCMSITDLSRASLAQYVAKRKAVIDLFEKSLGTDDNGRYSKEARIHSIMCPMKTTSDEINYDDLNLWLIDDRLAYHHYLASDKKMNSLSVLDNDSDKRMDLAIFDAALSYAADPENINSITIVELKRPQRDDYDKTGNPIDQVYEYVSEIKNGRLKKINGRSFGNVTNVAFYCYVIADITPSLKKRCELAGLISTQDKAGFFGYNAAIGTYIEVVSYDKLLKDAKQRNQALFDKLFEPKLAELRVPDNNNY